MGASKEPLIILGGGGHAAVVAEAAALAGWNIAGFLDDDDGAAIGRLKWLGEIAQKSRHSDLYAAHAAIGCAALREKWLEGMRPATVIHPTAVISPSARTDDGVFIAAGAIVGPRAEIGRGTIINTGAIVEHDCRIGPFCHLAPRAALGGGARVGDYTTIGIGASILPEMSIGARSTVGAGAVVIGDVPDNVVVAGVPARVIRHETG